MGSRYRHGPNPEGSGFLPFWALVVAGAVDGKLAREVDGGGVDDGVVEAVDEGGDGSATVASSEAR